MHEGDQDIDWLDLLIVLAKHKKKIATASLGATVLALVILFFVPNLYLGAAKLLPPQQSQTSAAMLLGQLSGLAGVAGSSLGIKNPSDLYVGMLRSRTVADNIINRFSLQSVYGIETMTDTRRELANKSSISAGKDGLIVVEYEDTDPKRAADVANAFVEELDKLTQSLAFTEAAQRRLFFERQLKQAKVDLADAEVALKVTQEKTGLIKLDEQGKVIIEAVAALRAQVAAKEIELRSMRTFATDANPDYVRAQQQLAGLRSELAKLEKAQPSSGGDVLLPTAKVPEAGLEYLRKLRDLKYQETMFELLAKQFEAAKIDEAKDAGTIQVVDRAVVPDRKYKPRRGVIAIGLGLVAAFFAGLWAFALEAKERAAQDPTRAARLATLIRYLSVRPDRSR